MTKKLRRAMAAELSEICDIKKKLFLYHFPSSFSIICCFFRLISVGNIIGMFAIGTIVGRIESHKNSAINIYGANRSGSIVSIKQIFRICSLEYSSVYIANGMKFTVIAVHIYTCVGLSVHIESCIKVSAVNISRT